MAGRLAGIAAVLIGLALAPMDGRAAPSAEPTAIAITDFGFVDTSGEIGDQQAAHAARLADLTRELKTDLGGGGRYRVLSLACGGAECRAADPAALVAEARQAGARMLVLGDVHKTSTLLLSTKVQVLDVQTNTLLLDRFLSFRGDNDEAWRRMTHFIARELEGLALDGAKP